MNDLEQEERALDALIVLALRFSDDEAGTVGFLPDLTDEDKAALGRLDPGLIDRVIKETKGRETDSPSRH